MTLKLIFSFDSEGYETPAADDAEKWWAASMTRYGITACVCIVGELARGLRERGRADVITAMARHEIAYHSDRHSAHPTWAEYLDTEDWEAGVARVLREESLGIAEVAETFGQWPAAWCKPGASWGPQVAHAMRQMNVPVFCDAPFEAAPGRPLWYAGNLCLSYHFAFDDYFAVPHSERLAKMQAGFDACRERHENGYLIIYTHPMRLLTSRFSDTFTGGKNPPRSDWRPAPLRPESEIAEIKEDLDRFLAWVTRQPGVETTTYRALSEAYRPPAAPWVSAATILELYEDSGQLDFRTVDGVCLSPAEQFGILARALVTHKETGHLPGVVSVRNLLGPTQAPVLPRQRQTIDIPVRSFVSSARFADEFCLRTRSIPSAIPVADGLSVAPGAWMRATLHVLAQPDTETVRFDIGDEANEYPAIIHSESFQRLHFQGDWSEFPPDFAGEKVLETIRLQAWTAKPAEARPG